MYCLVYLVCIGGSGALHHSLLSIGWALIMEGHLVIAGLMGKIRERGRGQG